MSQDLGLRALFFKKKKKKKKDSYLLKAYEYK